MKPFSALNPFSLRCPRRLVGAAALALAVAAAILPAAAQDAAPPPAPDAAPSNRANGGGRGRGNYNPEAMLENLRKRLGVTDDAEWSVIAARITAVRTLQRGTGGFGGFRGNGGNPEQQALREAVTDQLPDAEIKARLERFRAVRKENEAKLVQARADLVAVLTVRQEAMLVMMGLLP